MSLDQKYPELSMKVVTLDEGKITFVRAPGGTHITLTAIDLSGKEVTVVLAQPQMRLFSMLSNILPLKKDNEEEDY